MPCPTHEALIGYAAGDLDAPERQSVATHLSTDCPSCFSELQSIAQLQAIARSGALEMPPMAALEKAARIPSESGSSSLTASLGRLAALVFDSVRTPLSQGARSAATTSRQLLFRALDYEIDVRIGDLEPGAVRVAGQVLPGPDRDIGSVNGVEIALVRDGRVVGTSVGSDLGEFDFGTVPAGDYSLCVETDEDRILVENLSAHFG